MSRTNLTTSDIVLQLDTINQLFNTPAINPFSDKPIAVLGGSAVTRATRRPLGRPLRNWDGARLVIQLPADQITPDLQLKTTEAVGRYIGAKIEDNMLTARLSRTRGWVGLVIASVILVITLTLFSILLAGPLENVGEVVRGWIVAFVGSFA